MVSGTCLLIDASAQGELRLMRTDASGTGSDVRRYDANELPTFTDALIRYERETDTSLLGTRALLAIGGATSGNVLNIARSRWVISRPGLGAMFGRPVEVINDVAVRGWAAVGGGAVRRQLRGAPAEPDFSVPSSRALLLLDEGVGAAIVKVDQGGRTTILESELGHIDCHPATAAEEALCRALRSAGEQPSWEQVLLAALSGQGGNADDAGFAARLVGRLVAQVALAFAAWNGIILSGSKTAPLLQPAARQPFAEGYAMRQRFRRQLDAAPCWLIDQRDPIMTGLIRLAAEQAPAVS